MNSENQNEGMESENDETNYENIFYEACETGDPSHIARLIAENEFDVNQPLNSAEDFPLTIAVEEGSMPIVNFLLQNGAVDRDNEALLEAVEESKIEFVRLLLNNNEFYDLTKDDHKVLELAINCANLEVVQAILEFQGEKRVDPSHDSLTFAMTRYLFVSEMVDILELLLERMRDFVNDPDPNRRLMSKYIRLFKAIFKRDVTQVTQLLNEYNHPDFTALLPEYVYPLAFAAVRFGSQEMIELFMNSDRNLNFVCWEAVRCGFIDIVRLCAAREGSNIYAPDPSGRTLLFEACYYNQITIVKYLAEELDFKFCTTDLEGRTAIFDVEEPELLRSLFALFPYLEIDTIMNDGRSLLSYRSTDCELYGILLEHGANPRIDQSDMHNCEENIAYETIDDENQDEVCSCYVIRYLQKLHMINIHNRLERAVDRVLGKTVDEFLRIPNPLLWEYGIEVLTMQAIQFTPRTLFTPSRNLLEYLFYGLADAAIHSQNEIIQWIYREHNDDFRNVFPHYGYALNDRLRKGMKALPSIQLARAFLTFLSRSIARPSIWLILPLLRLHQNRPSNS